MAQFGQFGSGTDCCSSGLFDWYGPLYVFVLFQGDGDDCSGPGHTVVPPFTPEFYMTASLNPSGKVIKKGSRTGDPGVGNDYDDFEFYTSADEGWYITSEHTEATGIRLAGWPATTIRTLAMWDQDGDTVWAIRKDIQAHRDDPVLINPQMFGTEIPIAERTRNISRTELVCYDVFNEKMTGHYYGDTETIVVENTTLSSDSWTDDRVVWWDRGSHHGEGVAYFDTMDLTMDDVITSHPSGNGIGLERPFLNNNPTWQVARSLHDEIGIWVKGSGGNEASGWSTTYDDRRENWELYVDEFPSAGIPRRRVFFYNLKGNYHEPIAYIYAFDEFCNEVTDYSFHTYFPTPEEPNPPDDWDFRTTPIHAFGGDMLVYYIEYPDTDKMRRGPHYCYGVTMVPVTEFGDEGPYNPVIGDPLEPYFTEWRESFSPSIYHPEEPGVAGLSVNTKDYTPDPNDIIPSIKVVPRHDWPHCFSTKNPKEPSAILNSSKPQYTSDGTTGANLPLPAAQLPEVPYGEYLNPKHALYIFNHSSGTASRYDVEDLGTIKASITFGSIQVSDEREWFASVYDVFNNSGDLVDVAEHSNIKRIIHGSNQAILTRTWNDSEPNNRGSSFSVFKTTWSNAGNIAPDIDDGFGNMVPDDSWPQTWCGNISSVAQGWDGMAPIWMRIVAADSIEGKYGLVASWGEKHLTQIGGDTGWYKSTIASDPSRIWQQPTTREAPFERLSAVLKINGTEVREQRYYGNSEYLGHFDDFPFEGMLACHAGEHELVQNQRYFATFEKRYVEENDPDYITGTTPDFKTHNPYDDKLWVPEADKWKHPDCWALVDREPSYVTDPDYVNICEVNPYFESRRDHWKQLTDPIAEGGEGMLAGQHGGDAHHRWTQKWYLKLYNRDAGVHWEIKGEAPLNPNWVASDPDCNHPMYLTPNPINFTDYGFYVKHFKICDDKVKAEQVFVEGEGRSRPNGDPEDGTEDQYLGIAEDWFFSYERTGDGSTLYPYKPKYAFAKGQWEGTKIAPSDYFDQRMYDTTGHNVGNPASYYMDCVKNSGKNRMAMVISTEHEKQEVDDCPPTFDTSDYVAPVNPPTDP
jgi:hypothetical protein